jgi:hypothetical protein
MVLPAPIPLNPVLRMQPYHKPLVVSEEPGPDEEISNTVLPTLDQGRTLSLPLGDLPLRNMAETFPLPKPGPSESFWFSGSLSASDSLRGKGTSSQCDGNNTVEQPVNSVSQPGFGDIVRDRLPKFLSKRKPVVRDDGMYTILPTRHASKARKELQNRPRLPHFSFDGTGNQPPPLNSPTPSTNRSTTSTNHSTTSSVQRLTPSSKSSFRNLARDLIQPGRPGSPVDPRVIPDPLDPLKFDPMVAALEMSEPSDP